jgi:signal transduction histidine kinase
VTPVDERSFAIIFFDKELLEFAAPYEQHREIWGLRTSYGPQPIPEIVSASTRPQLALMIALAVAQWRSACSWWQGAAAREVRVAEIKSNCRLGVARLEDPLALIQLFAETLELGRVRTPDAQEYYRIINGEAKKLTRLIENILDFSA